MSDPDTPKASPSSPLPEVPQVPQVPDVPQVPEVPQIPGQSSAAPGSAGSGSAGSGSAPPPGYGAASPSYETTPGYVATATAKQPVLSIVSMVAGIVAVLGLPIAFVPIIGGILALFLPATAIVLGVLGRTREPQAKGFWLTGIITGAAAAAIALISILVWVLVFATLPSGNMYMNNGPF
ncbi:MAG: hypothetical protein R6W83_07610 [Cryobacterium sp.]